MRPPLAPIIIAVLASVGCAGGSRPASPAIAASAPGGVPVVAPGIGRGAAGGAPAPSPTSGAPEATAAFLAALERAPEVRAARARHDAARAAAIAAGVLGEPRISAEGRRMDSVHGLEVWVEQELPRWGERDAARAAARAEVAMARSELDMARGDLAVEVAGLQAEATAARARAGVQEAEAVRLRALAEAMGGEIAAGGGRAGEVLDLQTRREAAELMAADARRMALDADEELQALLGTASSVPSAPPPALIDGASVETAALRAARARSVMAAADLAEARSRRFPGVGIGVGWEREDLESDEDGWMGMLAMTIPLNREAYDASERAAHARGDAARREVEAQRLRADATLRRQRRAVLQAAAARRQADDAVRRSEAQLDAARAGLVAGEAGALTMLFDRLDALSAARLAAIEAEAEAARAQADLWRFATFPEP